MEDEIPKSKRPRLQSAENEDATKLSDLDFKLNLRTFACDHSIVVEDFEKFFHHVESVLGAESMADLEELQLDDLSEDKTGLKLIQQRKLLRAIERIKLIPPNAPQTHLPMIVKSDTTQAVPLPMDIQPSCSLPGPVRVPDLTSAASEAPDSCDHLTVRYIHCQNLFMFHAKEKAVSNLSPTTTLEELITLISFAEGVSKEMTLELFFSEGYPLDANKITLGANLSQWKITDGTLLYAFVRLKHQPGVKERVSDISPPCTEKSSHKATPMTEFTIHSFLNGIFVVHTSKSGGLKELQDKIFECTKVPPELFDLYLGTKWRNLMHDAMLQEAFDNESTELLMIPRPFYRLYDGNPSYAYGKCTYNPVVKQTDAGLAKFYSILYFMVKNSDLFDTEEIAGYVHKAYGCPPMTYALRLLFSHQVLQQLGCWVALFEGFFQLFGAILNVYCNVPDEKVFEFSEYLWGFIIQQARKANIDEHWSEINLICPITGVKITQPVCLPLCDDIFDRTGVLKKIKANEAVPGCTVKDLKEDYIERDECSERLLMCNLFHDCRCDLPLLKQSSFSAKSIRKLVLPTDVTWKAFSECNSQLCIKRSDLDSTQKTSLAYYKKNGYMVVKIGVLKSESLDPTIYNPLYDPAKREKSSLSVPKSMLTDGETKKINLNDFMNDKAKVETSLSLAVSHITTTPQLSCTESQAQSPLEAIVVTLDASTSMSEHIFPEKGLDYSRLQAAKDLFDAFLNRTQAYGLHHLVGLITFKSHATVNLALTERLSSFIGAINSVSPGGRTALYDAIAKACELLTPLLTTFPSCKRRILCLTDGEDTRSANQPNDVLDMLKKNEIVMDTVLITGSQGNLVQKALSFATGGYCFFPKSMVEATKVFEVETLVSLCQRAPPGSLSDDLDNYKSLAFTPANPYGNKALMSKFSQDLENASFTTTARMVEKSLLLGIPSVTCGTASTRNKRILRELRQYQSSPHPSVDVYPNEDNLAMWKMVLTGPDNTPYEKGVFLLFAKFPDRYPSKPPEIRFHTPIYHCNINSSGRICHSSLDKGYVPTQTIRGLVDNIYGLLMDPEPADPLDSVLALELHQNRAKYEKTAKEMTFKYASSDRQELKQTFIDVDGEVPKAYLCPLTKKLFTDPVITPYGHTYEREALIEYMSHNGPKDPIAQQPLDPSRLIPNSALKSIIHNFKQVSKELN